VASYAQLVAAKNYWNLEELQHLKDTYNIQFKPGRVTTSYLLKQASVGKKTQKNNPKKTEN